jgi:hypothetical protein
MQRGIVAPMDADLVRADVESGKVSDLALEYPWGLLDQYEKWLDGCRPVHANEAVSAAEKPPYGAIDIANFNNECYIPVYNQAQSDALTLVRRHPARYLHDRVPALAMSYQPAQIGRPDTWLDKVYGTVLLPVHVRIGMADWNLPLVKGLEATGLAITVSLTLIGLSLFIAGRGVLAVVRMVRIGWRDRAAWPAGELLWLVVAFTTAVIVLGGDLIEFGENGRFRATLDPLLLALPLAALALVIQRRREPHEPDPA